MLPACATHAHHSLRQYMPVKQLLGLAPQQKYAQSDNLKFDANRRSSPPLCLLKRDKQCMVRARRHVLTSCVLLQLGQLEPLMWKRMREGWIATMSNLLLQ